MEKRKWNLFYTVGKGAKDPYDPPLHQPKRKMRKKYIYYLYIL